MTEAERPDPDAILAQMKRDETAAARGKSSEKGAYSHAMTPSGKGKALRFRRSLPIRSTARLPNSAAAAALCR